MRGVIRSWIVCGVLFRLQIPQSRRMSDPSINYASLYTQYQHRYHQGERAASPVHHTMEVHDVTHDAPYSPGDTMNPVQALQRIGL